MSGFDRQGTGKDIVPSHSWGDLNIHDAFREKDKSGLNL